MASPTKASRSRKLPSPRSNDLPNGTYGKYTKDPLDGSADNGSSLQEFGKLLSYYFCYFFKINISSASTMYCQGCS